ncbi:multicopper oxidase family protein [Paenibacillus sp. MBLB4367]|uniref:multicopper oxidase family protein n=1 Tax=Paenibacillus sp. MBLB4367 TaxID=3384767 RepID=UPI0039083657
MKLRRKLKSAAAAAAMAALLAGCFNSNDSMSGMDHSSMNMGTPSPNGEQADTTRTDRTPVWEGRTFSLTAKTSNQEIAPGHTLPVWTFNNSVPGPELRVKQGENVQIVLKNELKEPATIHWHGVPVPNAMDGIPGVTQNAVQPGETFTYAFKAEVPGTYWYHSHQDSVNQVDRGMYGAFIVEPKNGAKPDRDYTLMLDEWRSADTTMSGGGAGAGMSGMNGMDHSKMNMGGAKSSAGESENAAAEAGHDMSMYDLYTINGKSGPSISELPVKKGETVRLRLINAGYLTHRIHLHGHDYRITAADGQSLNNPGLLRDSVVEIAPGERYDIEFVADNPGRWLIEDHSGNPAAKGMKAVIAYEGGNPGNDRPDEAKVLPSVDMSSYGEAGSMSFTLGQSYNLSYTMNLNTATRDGDTVYTINGKAFPETEPMKVKKGETVKVRLVNQSKTDDHPMHLHGHFFQVLSRNGKPLEGSPLIKDTLNLKPGEEYVVAFQADNEGNWMFHCHDLHHASAGMVTELQYAGFKPGFVPDPNAGNMPE